MPTQMNPAQTAAIKRAMEIVANIRAGGYKFSIIANQADVTLEKLKQFGVPYATGIDSIGAVAMSYLEAALNDKDYPADIAQ